jgi:hypothetical protein
MEDLYRLSSYLMEEEVHPLVFDLQVNDKTLLPQDD